MKQAKVISFIKLIGKIHQVSGDDPQSALRNNEHFQMMRKATRQKQELSSKTVNFIESEQHDQLNGSQRSRIHTDNDPSSVGIYFAEQSIKHRYGDKKSLYEVYRDSLQKKKASHNILATNTNDRAQLRRTQDELSRARELTIPLFAGSKLKQRRQSYTYQKIVRKKSLLLSNRSNSIFPQESEKHPRIRKLKTHQNEHSDDGLLQKDGDKSMRENKLNYKPIFRIKRLTLENCKTETAQGIHQHKQEVDKYSLSRRSVDFKKQSVQNDSRKHTLRERIKRKKEQKSKPLLKINQNFSAWEEERSEQHEELCKFLM